MTEQKSKAIMVNSIMLIAIITAYICRFIGKGAFYPTFHLYRPFRYVGNFCQTACCPKTGEKISDVGCGFAYFLDDGALGKIFYLLAGGCNMLCVVSLLSADDFCADVSVINCFVVGETR